MNRPPLRWGLTRVAFACQDLADIDGRPAISSRRVPRRDLTGGALFWIIRHTLVARQSILGVDEQRDADGAMAIFRLAPLVVPVMPRPCRSHQGWRYLGEGDWPADLGRAGGEPHLPPALVADLGALSLLD